ncbi:hypothetical protein P43SY_003904 [Pythium insidiosum]|uniref:Uncharacterized protein n=1 Tax=Pythium insidiosum TaxID=114742 RepID=A0AAD5Q7T8_PYTIN|nr:hypothetical protein P43SY_003904 [Pythium insidiosum]
MQDAAPRPKRRRRSSDVDDDDELDKAEKEMLQRLERRLRSVRDAKALLQQELEMVNNDAKRLEVEESKARSRTSAHKNRLSRMQDLQAKEAHRMAEVQRRKEEEAARLAKEREAAQQRQAHTIHVGVDDLDDLEAALLADESILI